MESTQTEQLGIDLVKTIASDNLPKFYANGFSNFQGYADMGILFQCNGKPNVLINLSFTLAKTLAQKLNQMIIEFEETTQTEIMTTDIVDERIQKRVNYTK